MKNIIILLLTLTFGLASSQNFEGTWKGDLEVMGQKLPLVFHISKEDQKYTTSMDSPLQGAMGIAVDETLVTESKLQFSLKMIGASYKGELKSGLIEGIFQQNGMSFPLILKPSTDATSTLIRPQTPKPPFHYNIEEVKIKNNLEGNFLAGSLTTPKNTSFTAPIIVMITGSGAQNRDEELFGHKPFLVIADYLAQHGISSLRMDDRGIGGSDKGKDHPTSADFATDINAAVDFLAKRGYKNIGLLGHSEGGMIAPIVANQNKNVNFLVLLAAPGEPLDQLMISQNKAIGKASGLSDIQLDSAEKTNQKIYDFIIHYKGKTLAQDLENFLLKEQGSSISDDQKTQLSKMSKQVSSPWFQYFIKFNPDQYLSKIKIPTLALNGSLDLQVLAKENLDGIKSSLKKAGNKNFKTLELPNLNHLFQTTKTGNPTEYGQIEETFSPLALKTITDWIYQL